MSPPRKQSPPELLGDTPRSTRRAVTLADVAEKSGVSRVATSVVLNNARSRARVSEATRQRIVEAAKELGYHANGVARCLRRRSTNTIGFYYPQGAFHPHSPLGAGILSGLIEGCELYKKNFMIRSAVARRDDDSVFEELLDGQIDGLIIYSDVVTPVIKRLLEADLPVVTLGQRLSDLPSVTVDDQQVGSLLARRLVDAGHRHIYFEYQGVLPEVMRRRLHGFRVEAVLRGANFGLNQISSRSRRGVLAGVEDDMQVIAGFRDFPHGAFLTPLDGNAARKSSSVGRTEPELPREHNRRRQPLIVFTPWDDISRQAVALLVACCEDGANARHVVTPVEFDDAVGTGLHEQSWF